MDNRSLFLQDISAAPDTIVGEVFNFLRYLKIKDSGIDIEDWIDSNELCGAMVTSLIELGVWFQISSNIDL